MIKLLCIIVVLLLLCLNAGGCSSVDALRENATIKMGFQPERKGVKDVNEIERALIHEIEENRADVLSDGVRNLIHKMTWRQACALYRTSSHIRLRGVLDYHIMPQTSPAEHPFFYGVWTKKDIIQLVGEPDGVEKNDKTSICRRKDVIQFLKEQSAIEKIRTIIYTGVGYVSDGVSGCILNFDGKGHLIQITPAN